jgi:hypothetical protein
MYVFMEEFNIDSFNLINKAITLVAPRESGKTHLITFLLLHTLKYVYNDVDVINIIILCQSLIDSNLYFKLYIITMLDKLLLKPNQSGIELINNFKLLKYINKDCIPFLCKNESDHIIKIVLNMFVTYLCDNNHVIKIEKKLYTNSQFYFNGSIQKSILTKLNNSEIKTNKNRKYIVIIDDVKKEAYKDIKDEVVMIYEQGRHHDTSIIVIDQYIKSKKVPPEIRETSSHLIFRNFDETIKKEINDICAFDKSSLDINTIKDLINNYYCIIIDFNNKKKLFYYNSPSIIFS